MFEKKKIRYRKRVVHPITMFIMLTIVVMILSSVLAFFNVQASYSRITGNNELGNVIVKVEGLFNSTGIKGLISDAAKNFANFAPLTTLLVGLIGLSVAHASGLIDTFIKRVTLKINNKTLTFIVIFLATISSIINDVGYVILIPLAALVFLANGRNPLLGITAAFCGVAFGYGVTFFAGSMEINLLQYTQQATYLVDSNLHVALLSNLIAIIISTVVVSIVGTFVIENVVSKRVGRYHIYTEEAHSETKEIKIADVEEEQQKRLEEESNEKKGLRNAFIAFIIFVLLFAYMIIPGLPGSGMLLDMNENAYINQLFGEKAYFQEGFTYLISMLFLVTGIAYAIGAKTIKNDKELIDKASKYLKDVGGLIALIFFAAQFISVFKKTNIGTVFAAFISGVIRDLPFNGLPLVLTVLILISITGLLVTTQSAKWSIFAPVVVPLFMQNNISPQFAQFVFRAADSMAKGFTPLLAFFVVYLGYLNVYNTEKDPITIKKAIQFIQPYYLIIGITWILIVSLIYIMGIPIGPGVSASL